MKNHYYKPFAILLLFVTLVACSSKSEINQEKIDGHWSKYRSAIEMGDYDVAANSVHSMLSLDSNNMSYYDTLAKLYFNAREYNSAFNAAEKALKDHLNEPTLNIAFQIAKASKNIPKALHYGEEMLRIHSDSLGIQYDMALLYIRAMDFEKARKQLDLIVMNPKSVEVEYNEYSGKTVQRIPFRAAAYNLIGFIQSEQGKLSEAKSMFLSALDTKENYQLANENLTVLQSMMDSIQLIEQ